MKLILTSAGFPKDVPEVRKALLKVLDKKPQETKVAFIPTAADPEDDKWFVKASRDELLELGFQVEDVDLKGQIEEPLYEKLKDFDIVYVNGGNTFYLLNEARKSGFDKVVKKLLEKGVMYIGCSAGSVLAGPNIEISSWDPKWDANFLKLKDLTGLNLVPFAISPHFQNKDKKLIEEKAKDTKYPVIGLTDNQAVFNINSQYEIIGEGEKLLYTHDFSLLLPVDDWTLFLEKLILDIAKIAKAEKKDYYIGGGFALDIAYGKLTRFHEDLDFYPMEKDKEFWQDWFNEKGFETKQEPWTKNYPNAYIAYDKDYHYTADIYPVRIKEDGEVSMLNIDGNYYPWVGKSWKDTKLIPYKGEEIRVENYKTVLSQKIEEHKKKGVPIREKDRHDFHLFNEKIII